MPSNSVLNSGQIAVRQTQTSEGEALPSGRDDCPPNVRPVDSKRAHVRDHDIAAVPKPAIHHATAIVEVTRVGQDLGHRRPVAIGEVRKEAAYRTACGVFQLPWRGTQFVERRERGIEVRLVEDFKAAELVTFDGQQVDASPLGRESLLRGPA